MRCGAVRDHLLGFRGVNGLGEAFKAGGKVVKNVTGFDLPKLVCGAFGTLCVLTEVTLRVFPKPPLSATLAVRGLSAEDGLALLRKVWSSPLDATGLAFSRGNALIRLEGEKEPLAEKCALLRTLIGARDVAEIDEGEIAFRAIGSGEVFADTPYDVWRAYLPPASAAQVAEEIDAPLWLGDWAGGLLWLGTIPGSDSVRDVVKRAGGHCVLLRAEEETRERIAVFEPEDPARAELTRARQGGVRSARAVQSRPDVGRGLMRTNFTPTQLTDPHLAEAEKNLRACVHCGICTATCPTYVLLGDERDGPRGRIVLMQNMLEKGGAPDAETVLHVDRCLSCLACRTACPSSVDYARLVDEARAHIQTHYRRPLGDKMLRWLIATVMPRPALVRGGLLFARVFAPLVSLLPGRLGAMARLGARRAGMPTARCAPILPNARRIALMPGCARRRWRPTSTRRWRGCWRGGASSWCRWRAPAAAARWCIIWGAARTPRTGRGAPSKRSSAPAARFEGVLITATGCSAHLKDLTHLFLDDPLWLPRARRFAAASRDFLDLATPGAPAPPTCASPGMPPVRCRTG